MLAEEVEALDAADAVCALGLPTRNSEELLPLAS
jgi:hypothetical protein